ncbi:MAG: beta-ketoacyl-[acyl-carrier-protein] synthase II [Bacillota bacterium]|nr:MAG: beta-ketoacyl-[acyl-carrier-protein] synthase II [Bacillota bacterium]
MEKRRVVITGLGTVNPTGNTTAESWAAVRRGECGVAPITAFDTTDFKIKLAAEVKNFDPAARMDKRDARKMARFTQFAVAAAAEAMEDCGLVGDALSEADAQRFATVISSGVGGLPTIEEEHARGEAKGFERVSPFFVPMAIANMAAGQVAIRFGLKGMCTCPVTACAGGTNAIGDAFHLIRDGYADLALCGGTESCISPLGVGGFSSMKALSTATDPNRASIPFDAERGGFVIGEGCGLLVLEELEHAKARGAKIYAEMVGYGATCDAHHITAPAPNGEGGARSMALALADAGIAPEQVGYINAHGTGTHLNDSGETAAIKTVFGEHAHHLAVSSTKSMTGHLLGGAGGVEGVFTALALHDGFLPATINLQQPDPECDLDYIPNVGRAQQVDYAMSDSLGFGGHNACVVFKRWEG